MPGSWEDTGTSSAELIMRHDYEMAVVKGKLLWRDFKIKFLNLQVAYLAGNVILKGNSADNRSAVR